MLKAFDVSAKHTNNVFSLLGQEGCLHDFYVPAGDETRMKVSSAVVEALEDRFTPDECSSESYSKLQEIVTSGFFTEVRLGQRWIKVDEMFNAIREYQKEQGEEVKKNFQSYSLALFNTLLVADHLNGQIPIGGSLIINHSATGPIGGDNGWSIENYKRECVLLPEDVVFPSAGDALKCLAILDLINDLVFPTSFCSGDTFCNHFVATLTHAVRTLVITGNRCASPGEFANYSLPLISRLDTPPSSPVTKKEVDELTELFYKLGGVPA